MPSLRRANGVVAVVNAFGIPAVNQSEINHWAKVAVDLEVAGEIDSLFYERARAFAFGEPDPTPQLTLVMPQEEAAAA
ncbi:MAG: hypothetical protein O2972_09955 [Cyanobacteria bacterium]|nr:hypothetical protein [Synechococcus sp. BS307-5m-G38]MDA0258996.1 hypothetical protein [Cyanobacteriota bacterium]